MDELRDFYSAPAHQRVVRLRGPQTSGVRLTKEDSINKLNRREDHRSSDTSSGTEYARDIKERETERYIKVQKARMEEDQKRVCLDSFEHLSLLTLPSLGTSLPSLGELTEEALTEVYKKYSFKKDTDLNFDINEHKTKIMDCIACSPVTIIEGPTGCGKTTQVPQWILDDCFENRKQCKIIVTQPRRIAAISIAKRVAQERGWDVGGLVGYQVGLENQTSNDTRLSYVTTGLLLQKLVASQNLNEYSHVILDEVHERGQEMDFLMLVVKKFLFTNSCRVKVILMSATFNTDDFAEYFSIHTYAGRELPTVVTNIKRKRKYTVKTFYLNHLRQFTLQLPQFQLSAPGITTESYHLVLKLLNAFELIDQKEEKYENRSEVDLPSVLIFLPGINEIEELFGYLVNMKIRAEIVNENCTKYKWTVLPLHSTITADEQIRVFQRTAPGDRKIILSTNIAESSITVPDVKYVIDFCLMKVLVANEQTNFTSLQLQWASKTNCEQRAGRAGRVRDGRVYRLVPESFYDTLHKECRPEICRCPLERLVLLAKMLNMGSPKEILALAMNPPDLSNIQRTVQVLKEIGGLLKTYNGRWSNEDGDITFLGRIMAKLPVDVRISKLIILGYIFGCLEETVIMGAAMSVKNVFSSPFQERLNAYNSKLTWADGSTSDCIAFLNVYKVWNHMQRTQVFKQSSNDERQWARRFYIQLRALKELDLMVRELNSRLSRESIEAFRGKSPWSNSELPLVLKVLLAGAFYPNYFVQSCDDEIREREAVKMLNGLDPRTTVYMKDFPPNQPGRIYAASIKNIIHKLTGDDARVTFDSNSCKVYLTFSDTFANSTGESNARNPTIPGNVVLPVYKAVKARQLKMEIRISLLSQDDAKKLEAALEEENMGKEVNRLVPRLPDLDDSHFPIKISQFINCGHFWAQYDDKATSMDLNLIQRTINNTRLLANTKSVVPGDLYVAPYQDPTGTQMYRVCVQKLMPNNMVWVFYIDYGTFGRVNICNLRVLPLGPCTELPPLAMECVLAEVAPNPRIDAHGQWTKESARLFEEIISRGRMFAKVYSVAHGVVSIILMARNGELNVNELLIEKSYAQPAEESYESKLNHDLRNTSNDLNLAQKRAYNKQQLALAFHELNDIKSPKAQECVANVNLKGPFSPLETTVHGMLYGSREKQINIEWNSVNSVLLDTEPQEIYEKLLVSGSVGENTVGDKLTLRHTTLMPNIPGLPAIISLLFCPTMELRRDESKSRYVSMLCGLGYNDEDGRPLFPEHDMLVNIDVDLSVDDLGLINHIRYLMDYMIYCGEGQDMPCADEDFKPKVPGILREKLMSLLWARRKHTEITAVPYAWEWKSAPEEDLLEINDPDMLERSVIYPLHSPLDLSPLTKEALLALKKENDEMKKTVGRTPISSSKEVACKLCGTNFMPTQAMRIHLFSRSHLEKEADFRRFES